MTTRDHSLVRVLAAGGLAAAVLAAGGCASRAVSAASVAASSGRAQSIATTTVATAPKNATAAAPVTRPAPTGANAFIPPGRGAGAAKEPDLAKAPVVPNGQELKDYIAAYYQALRDKDWTRANGMVPPAERGETVKDFEKRQLGYEAGVANILSAGIDPDGKGTATVVLLTPEHGVWNVEWRFARTKRGTAVRDLVYARPGGAG